MKELSATSHWLLQFVAWLRKLGRAFFDSEELIQGSQVLAAIEWLRKNLGLVGSDQQKEDNQWRFFDYWKRFFPVMLFSLLLLPPEPISFIIFLPGLLLLSSSSSRMRAALLWLAWSFISTLFSPSFPHGLISFFRESVLILAAVSAGLYCRGKKSCFQVILLSSALMISLAFLQAYVRPPFPSSWVSPVERGMIPFRITGAGDNPNVTGLWLAYMLPLLLVGWESEKLKKKERYCSGILFLLSFPAIIFTFSRTTWVAAFFTLVFYWLPEKKLKIIRLIFILMVVVFIFPSLSARILQNPLQSSTFEYRFRIWQEIWEVVKKHPVTGGGKEVLNSYLDHISAVRADHLHNHYLQLVVEKGIFALVLFYWIVYKFIISPYYHNKDLAQISLLKKGVTAALICQLVAGLTESIWVSPLLHFLFWFGFALLEEDKEPREILKED